MRRVVAALVAGSAVLVIAGCSGGTDGTAEPAPTTGSVSSSQAAGDAGLPNSGAPAVTNPLPESALAGDPCQALTRQQVTEALGDDASQGERRDLDSIGPRCDWQGGTSSDGGFSLSFGTKSRQGLSGFYANAKPKMEVFRELAPVEGFPAVAYKSSDDARECTVGVGLADEYTLSITGTQSSAREGEVDSCDATEMVTALVVKNLKQKAGGS